MRRALHVLAAVTLLGCGDDDDNSEPVQPGDTTADVTGTTGESETSTPPLEHAVRSYTAAVLGGDAQTSYELLSDRCRNEMARNDFGDIVAQLAEQYSDAEITSYDEEVNGTAATATYELTDSVLNQTEERWVLEDGTWHNDDC